MPPTPSSKSPKHRKRLSKRGNGLRDAHSSVTAAGLTYQNVEPMVNNGSLCHLASPPQQQTSTSVWTPTLSRVGRFTEQRSSRFQWMIQRKWHPDLWNAEIIEYVWNTQTFAAVKYLLAALINLLVQQRRRKVSASSSFRIRCRQDCCMSADTVQW